MKRIFALILALIMCLPLCACGSTDDSVFGTYKGEYLYDGNQFSATIILYKDMTFSRETYKNGELVQIKSGEFEFEDGQIKTYPNGKTPDEWGILTIGSYDLEGNALVRDGHYFYKK